MTIDELIEQLTALQTYKHPQLGWDDWEAAHSLADALLVAYINDQRVTDAFAGITRWYA